MSVIALAILNLGPLSITGQSETFGSVSIARVQEVGPNVLITGEAIMNPRQGNDDQNVGYAKGAILLDGKPVVVCGAGGSQGASYWYLDREQYGENFANNGKFTCTALLSKAALAGSHNLSYQIKVSTLRSKLQYDDTTTRQLDNVITMQTCNGPITCPSFSIIPKREECQFMQLSSIPTISSCPVTLPAATAGDNIRRVNQWSAYVRENQLALWDELGHDKVYSSAPTVYNSGTKQSWWDAFIAWIRGLFA